MGKNVVFLYFICIYFMELVQLTPVPYRHLSKEELNQIALDCIDEIKIDRTVIEKVLATQILPKENPKYKKYLACSYKKQGFLSADGKEMLYNNIFKFLEQFYDMSQLQSIEHCKKIQEDDVGELCFQHLDCILDGLRKAELQDEIVSNDIE